MTGIMGWQLLLATLATFLATTQQQLTREQMTQISLKARKLPYDVCGQSDIFKEKLVDGSKVTLGAYPWMAAIGYTKNDSSQPLWLCAGNLVTDQYVVTVAHCIKYSTRNSKLSVVRLGDLDLNDTVNDGASPVDIGVEKILFHPDFNNRIKVNDIGLIKLKSKVQFDYTKKPICLPSPEFSRTSFLGYSSAIIGWGKNEVSGTTHLTEASVDIKDLESCRKNYTSIMSSLIMDERVICASSPGKDSCQGDSGGPLMMYRRYRGKDRMYLLGMVTYGYRCAEEGFPGVYTNVTSFMYWIIDNLEFD